VGLFKILLLQFLYDISDRRIMEEVYLQMGFKWFCGLEPDEEPPHPMTLTYFRSRLGVERFARIHNRIVALARESGLISDRLSVVDATHVASRMNSFKVDDENPPDPDARRGGRGGGVTFVGYKAHLALDADSGLITKEEAIPGQRPRGREAPRDARHERLSGDRRQGLRLRAQLPPCGGARDALGHHGAEEPLNPCPGGDHPPPLAQGRPKAVPQNRAQGS
jgi:IS5 family transposase